MERGLDVVLLEHSEMFMRRKSVVSSSKVQKLLIQKHGSSLANWPRRFQDRRLLQQL